MTNQHADDLINEVKKNFEVIKPPYLFKILRTFDSWDYDPEVFFSNKSWKDLLEVDLKRDTNKFGDLAEICTFLTTRALFNFLPAFMIITLESMCKKDKRFPWNEAGYIESSLTSDFREDFEINAINLTSTQKSIVALFLLEIFLTQKSINRNGLKSSAQISLEDYWFTYLSEKDLQTFSILSASNQRNNNQTLTDEEIEKLVDVIRSNGSKIEKPDDNYGNITKKIDSINQLLRNNQKRTDEILISLGKNKNIPKDIRDIVKLVIRMYGVADV